MNPTCFVCNIRVPLAKTHIKDIFSNLNTLPSSRKLLDTLEEILEKPLVHNYAHSKILCRKCYKACVDYDGYKSKMNVIKLEMSDEFSTTLQKWPTLDVPILDKSIKTPAPSVWEDKRLSTVVVPASKLQPVPADFRLNFTHLAGFGKPNLVSNAGTTPLINLKVTIGSSVFTQSLKTSTVKIGKPVEFVDTSDVITSVKSDVLTDWNVNLVPNDIFSTTTTQNGTETGDDDDDDCDESTDKGDDSEMKIVEVCNVGTPATEAENQVLPFDIVNIKSEDLQTPNDTQFINMNLPSVDSDGNGGIMTSDGNYVKLKIYNEGDDDDEDDEQHTIVVDGDNASILEMMTGQKFIYENGELSLMMQDDEGNNNDGDNDGQDSNDESQIELQVSGDEETANAIIAAAQERGGAFIKVEGGEMYRVKSVQSKSGDNSDVSTFVTKVGNDFRCMLCHKLDETESASQELLNATDMMNHLKAEHDAKIYLCQLCGVGMRKRQDYTRHIAEHSKKLAAQKGNNIAKSKLHTCVICEKSYNSRTLLQEHMNTHTGTRPYQCHLCEKTFASKYTHQAHLKTHQNRPRPFKCEQCHKSFLSQQNLSQHEKTHLGVKNFVCNVCDKAFGTQHNLEVHGVVHSGARPYGCSQCHKAFARKAELADHMRIHTGERPFECEICGVRFAQRSNLHSHRRATHLDDKRHQCPHCAKRFKRRRLLEYHVKASHTGERPLVCEVCTSTFVYPEHYKKHMRIHSGERPYYCEICGKSFNSRDNRNIHRFTHSDKKPYECLTCGESYMRKRLLIAHMNHAGHLAESIVVNQPRVTRVHNTESGITTIVQLNDQAEVPTNDQNQGEAIFQTSGKLELLSEDIRSSSFNKMSTDSKLFINDPVEPLEIVNSQEPVNSIQLETQTSQLGTDENAAVLRLIQVKLPDGHDGWVALND